jgi:hypothetical protein
VVETKKTKTRMRWIKTATSIKTLETTETMETKMTMETGMTTKTTTTRKNKRRTRGKQSWSSTTKRPWPALGAGAGEGGRVHASESKISNGRGSQVGQTRKLSLGRTLALRPRPSIRPAGSGMPLRRSTAAPSRPAVVVAVGTAATPLVETAAEAAAEEAAETAVEEAVGADRGQRAGAESTRR